MDKNDLLLAVSVIIGLLIFFGFVSTVIYMDYAGNQKGLSTCVSAGGSWARDTCILDKSE